MDITQSTFAPCETIERLEAQLHEALTLKSSLEQEVARMIQYILIGPQEPIEKLPTELWVDIFEIVVRSRPMHINRLMLVCRSWHQIIISTPLLWSTIHIMVPRMTEKITQCARYCALCVERSSNYPLEISIEYPALDTTDIRIERLLQSYATDFSAEVHRSMLSKDPPDHWEYTQRRKYNPFYKVEIFRCLEPLDVLTGPAYSVMERWKSFSLLSHDTSIQDAPFREGIFGGRTPLLEKLELQYPFEYTEHNDAFGPFRMLNISLYPLRPFPYMPVLKEAILVNIEMQLCMSEINKLGMTNLSIYLVGKDSLHFCFACQNLRSLRIDGSWMAMYRSHVWRVPSQSFPLYHLEYLEVLFTLPREFFQNLIAPSLKTAVFINLSALHYAVMDGIALPPSVTRVECRWSYREKMPYDIGPLARAALQIPSLVSLLCTRKHKAIFEDALLSVHMSGNLPKSFSTLLVAPSNWELDPDRLETIQVNEIHLIKGDLDV